MGSLCLCRILIGNFRKSRITAANFAFAFARYFLQNMTSQKVLESFHVEVH